MANFFTDNADLVFNFERLDISESVRLGENDYSYCAEYPHAPRNYEDAKENARRVLELVGDISANVIAPNAASVDEEGAVFNDGKVEYAKGTQENLKRLSQADLMGMILPYKYGGLNFPFAFYGLAIEVVSRADASLMNIFGLQDIADCIRKFGSDAQCEEFLPKFATGEYTGAMALTEPDAGSDLQAVKLEAYELPNGGGWRLRGVKRFITNGNGDVLLVLARTEPGSTDGRGLSMFVCMGDDTVRVRRIENKHGIHGSPTCELEFKDTPAQLVGKRRLGLVKYVLDLMYRARMGVSAQALGTAQAAFEEALRYAKERQQFGKPIIRIPVVADMLIDMRTQLEANRALFCFASLAVDKKEKLDEHLDHLKSQSKPFADVAARGKVATAIAGLLTPITKYVVTESCNKIIYDAVQIHAGAGYMKEYQVERLSRDVRITNIYEGTSQLQVVAATGGVMLDVLADFFTDHEAKEYKAGLSGLGEHTKEIRQLYLECRQVVTDRKDSTFKELAGKHLVSLYSDALICWLLIDQAEERASKAFVAKRFVLGALSRARASIEAVRRGVFEDVLHADDILA